MQTYTTISNKSLAAFFTLIAIMAMSSLFTILVSQTANAKPSKTERREAMKVWRNAKKKKIAFVEIYPGDNKAATTPRKNIATIANGKEALTTRNCAGRDGVRGPYKDVRIDIRVLKFMNALATKTKFGVTSLVGQCHTANSKHYFGDAIDISCQVNKLSRADIAAAKRIAKKLGMSKNWENCTVAGNNHHHFEVN